MENKEVKNCYGQIVHCKKDDYITKKIESEGIYDRTGLYFMERILSKLKNPVCFDVGSNIGNHALRMSVYSDKVYLFEPQTEICDLLEKTKESNNIKNWEICRFGLGEKDEKSQFYVNPNMNIKSSFIRDDSQFSIINELSIRKGDYFVRDVFFNKIDFMKIDVEGYESNVIRGLKLSIRMFKPIIFMEWDKDITREKFEEENIFKEIFYDYEVKSITRVKGIFGKIPLFIRNTFYSNKRISWKIGKFKRKKDYRNIVLFPKEKIDLFKEFF